MKTTHLALLVGLFMGAVLAFGSFANFVLVALCGVVGWAWAFIWRAGSMSNVFSIGAGGDERGRV